MTEPTWDDLTAEEQLMFDYKTCCSTLGVAANDEIHQLYTRQRLRTSSSREAFARAFKIWQQQKTE